MGATMIFSQLELDLTKGLADAFVDILTRKYNYTYTQDFKQKVYAFTVDQVWKRKIKEHGKILTESEFDKFVDALFYVMLINEKAFLKEFDSFKYEYSEEKAIIREIYFNEIAQNVKSKYLN